MKKLILNIIILLGICNISMAQNALNFDGTNNFVQTNYSGVLDTIDRTFEAWIFIRPDAPASPLAIVDYGVNIAGSRNTFSVSGSRQLTFISGGGTNANISSPANSVFPDRWHHVAFVLDNGTGFLYVDGDQVGTGPLANVDTPTDEQDLRIGQRVSGGSIPFHGSIDEVRIWSTAKSQAELQANMNNEICSPEPDLQLYLRLNQGVPEGDNATITEAIDDSGNSYIGTLNSFMLFGTVSNWVKGYDLNAGFSFGSETITTCDSYTWAADSTTYTVSGNYSTVIASGNISGCDSIVSLDLIINGQSFFDTTSISSCEEYIWQSNGQTYTSTGMYTEMYATTNGCDSMITLDLTILGQPDTSVTYDGDLTLTSNSTDASYQWLDCDNGFAPISNATAQSYLAPTNGGSFAVIITTANGCVDTSACITVDEFTNTEDLAVFGSISLFPNPTKYNTTLSFGKQISNLEIIITDVLGRMVSTSSLENIMQTTIDIEGDAGIYFIQITDGANHQAVFKVMKI